MEKRDILSANLLTQIEAYYDGTLSAEEGQVLRAALTTDPQLRRAAAAWERVVRYGLHSRRVSSANAVYLRALLADAETRLTALRQRSRRRLALSLVAAVLLLFGIGWWGALPPDPTATLARESFVFLPRESLLLGPERDGEEALAAYDRQAYDQAYPALRAGVADGSLDSTALLFAGVSAVALNLPGEARAIFSELLETGRLPDHENDIRYFLALAELQCGNPAVARTHLNQAGGGARVQGLLQALEGLGK